MPDDSGNSALPDDVKRNTYTADREPGLHTKGLGDSASGAGPREEGQTVVSGSETWTVWVCPNHGPVKVRSGGWQAGACLTCGQTCLLTKVAPVTRSGTGQDEQLWTIFKRSGEWDDVIQGP